jgi:hypothetical protein
MTFSTSFSVRMARGRRFSSLGISRSEAGFHGMTFCRTRKRKKPTIFCNTRCCDDIASGLPFGFLR